MPDPVSIRERIERVIVARAALIAGISEAERWDALGNTSEHESVVIASGDEAVEPGGQGSKSLVTCRLPVELLFLNAATPGGGNASAVHTQWLAKLEAGVLLDGSLDGLLMVEPGTGARLAVDTRITGRLAPPINAGSDQPDVYSILALEIEYRHFAGDPYAAPGVARIEE